MSGHYGTLSEVWNDMKRMGCIEGVALLLTGLTESIDREETIWAQAILNYGILEAFLRPKPHNIPLCIQLALLPWPKDEQDKGNWEIVLKERAARVFLWCIKHLKDAEVPKHLGMEVMSFYVKFHSMIPLGDPQLRRLALIGFDGPCARAFSAQILYRLRDWRTLGKNLMVEAGPLVWEELRLKKGFGADRFLEAILEDCEENNEHHHECAYLRMCLARYVGRQLLRDVGAKLGRKD